MGVGGGQSGSVTLNVVPAPGWEQREIGVFRAWARRSTIEEAGPRPLLCSGQYSPW